MVPRDGKEEAQNAQATRTRTRRVQKLGDSFNCIGTCTSVARALTLHICLDLSIRFGNVLGSLRSAGLFRFRCTDLCIGMMLQHFFTESSRDFILGGASFDAQNRVPASNEEKRRMRVDFFFKQVYTEHIQCIMTYGSLGSKSH
jgi:hypothetical protein